jgi:hypothetical protein
MLNVDLDTPRQARGLAEQFLIPPVTQTPNRLRQRDTRYEGIKADRQSPASTMCDPNTNSDTESDSPGNTETALPNLERVDPSTLIRAPIGCDVVEPRPDKACGHSEERYDVDIVGITAPITPSLSPQFNGGKNAKGDHQAVHMKRAESVR